MEDHNTWALLRPDTPYYHLFPEGEVPIRSIFPIQPRDTEAPLCFLVCGNLLSDQQVEAFADMLLQKWTPECRSLQEAIDYIRQDLPLATMWFDKVYTEEVLFPPPD